MLCCETRGVLSLRFGSVERGCRRLELGVGFVGFFQDLLRFISGEALFSCKLEGLELGVGSACLHLFITNP